MTLIPPIGFPLVSTTVPEIVPKRFDVAFYVLPVPRGSRRQPQHRTSEATRSGWEPARRLLADLSAGRLTMLTPTRVILEEIVALGPNERQGYRLIRVATPQKKLREGIEDVAPDGYNTQQQLEAKRVRALRMLHHAAWVTRDQEATRHFYEDIIGLPLTATWAERAPSTGEDEAEEE